MNKKVPFLAGALAVICAMFGIALFNVATPATAHAAGDAVSNFVGSITYSSLDSEDFVFYLVKEEGSICSIDGDYYGEITATIYEGSDNQGTRLSYATSNGGVHDVNPSINNDNKAVLVPEKSYFYEVSWTEDTANGFDAGSYSHVLTVQPEKVSNMFDESAFEGCAYDNTAGWGFYDNSWFAKIQDSDDVYPQWYYLDGEDHVQITSATNAGNYTIYLELTGDDAERYIIDNCYWNDIENGDQVDLTTVGYEWTLSPKAVNVQVVYYGSDLNMYSTTPVANNLYYNAGPISNLTASVMEPGLSVEIAGWKKDLDDANEEPMQSISELGIYYAVYSLEATSDGINLGNYYISAGSNCQVVIGKRVISINPQSTVEYTGEEVYPTYEIIYTTHPAEPQSEVHPVQLKVNDSSILGSNLGNSYKVVLELCSENESSDGIDYVNNYLIEYPSETYSITREWNYEIVAAPAQIEFTEVAPWYYKEAVTDISEKLAWTVTTNSIDEDQVEVADIEWSNDGGSSWTSFGTAYPTSLEVPTVEGNLLVRVSTSASESGNFYATQEVYTFTIEKAPVYVRSAIEFTYNGEEQRPEENRLVVYIYKVADGYEADAILGTTNEDYIYANNTQAQIDAGEYNIQIALDNSKLNNYYYTLVLDDEGAKYKINKKTLYVTSSNASIEYGDELPVFAVNYSGFVDGESASDLGSAPYATTEYVQFGNVGEYDITLDGGYSNNYEFDFSGNSAKLTVSSRPVTITSIDATSVYGENIVAFEATNAYTNDGSKVGIVNGDAVYTLVCYEENTNEGDDLTPISSTTAVGSYRIYIVDSNNGNYMLAMIPTGYYTITNATLQDVSASQDENDKFVYNASAQTATVNASATAINGQEVAFTYSTEEEGAYTSTVPSFTNAGTHTVYYKVAADNHNVYAGSFTVVIAQKDLTITAENKNVQYGNTAPAFTVTYDGFAGDEDESDLSGTLAYECGYAVTAGAGSVFTITPGSLTSDNYDIHFENGTLTVIEREVTVSYTGESKEVTYYDEEAFDELYDDMTENFWYLEAELVNDDVLTNGLINITFEDGEHNDVTETLMQGTLGAGTYYIVVTDNSANYDFTIDLGENAYLVIANATMVGVQVAQNGELTYNGEEQQATVNATATTVDDCAREFTYSTAEDGEFSDEVPAFTTAGEHTVYYKVTADNHNDVTGDFKVTIAQKEITANFTNTTKTYNGLAQTPDFTGFTGLVGEDDVDVNFTAGAITVGLRDSYPFELTGEDKDNYVLTESTVAFTIEQLEIAYTALLDGEADLTVTYNGEEHTLTLQVTNAQEDDEVAIEITANGVQTNAGSYVATLSITGEDEGNYKFADGENEVSWNIEKATWVLENGTFNYYYGIYDGESHTILKNHNLPAGLTCEYYVLILNQGAAEYTNTLFEGATNAGMYYVEIRFAKDGNHNDLASILTYVEIRQKEVTLTWALTDEDKDEISYVYNGVAQLPSVTAGNLVAGDEVGVTVEGEQTNVGYYLATAVSLDNANYKLPTDETITHSFEITRAPLTVTVDAKTVTYGDAEPEYTAVITGYVAKETEDILEGELEFYSGYSQGSGVSGKDVIYLINACGLTSDNYDISYEPAELTVNPKAITVTYTSVHKAVTYGDMDAWEELGDEMMENYFYLTAEWVGNDNVWGVLEFSLNTEADESGEDLDMTGETFPDAGKYYFIIKGASQNYNYTIDLGDEAYLLINPRQVTITASNKTSVYGDAVVALEAVVTGDGLADGDEDADVYSLECKVDNVAISSVAGVGSYTITVVSANNPNYAVTPVAGVYQITPRPVTYTIADKTSHYGDEVEQIGASLTSGTIVNNDTNIYTLSCSATAQSDVNTYAITGEGLNNNYNITFVNGTYTITARPITVTIANKTSHYGDTVLALTSVVTAGSIVSGDQNVYRLNCEASNTSHVGNYAITGTKLDTNYDITFVNGTYAIVQREVTLTWGDSTFVYDETTHLPTATAGNVVNGDTVNVYVTGGQINAGEYTATAQSLSNADYRLPANVTHAFTITKPASYDKPIDPETIAEEGLDLTNVFKNIDTTEDDAELKFDIGTSELVFDKTAVEAIAGSEEAVRLTFNTKSDDEAKEIAKDAVFAFEITLDGATFADGTATVTADFENKAPTGKVARVYYVDANGRRTNMNATFENGKVTFKTNHFSNYIVVYELSTFSIILIVLLILILVAVIVLVVLYFILKKKGIDMFKFMKKNKENKVENKEEVKAESKEEAKEEVKEEEKKEEPKQEEKPATKKSGEAKAKKQVAAKKNPSKKK